MNGVNLRDLKWSKSEKETARWAFEAAYERECAAVKKRLKDMIGAASEAMDLWRIHDYLSEQRARIDEKYDYRYSVLPFLFARLLSERWLTEADLQGLADDKTEAIKHIASFEIK